jgi:hypothetical protein
MKNLALAFCSIRPSHLNESICDARENEYHVCLQQLKRVLPKTFDLVICENTIDDESEIKNGNLKKFLSSSEIVSLGSKANIGTNNKGMGELLMLKTALDEIDIDKYKNISYITARRLFTCPYVFERTERLGKQALISNPDVVFLDGRFAETSKNNLYNDMFFSMNSQIMVDYANYSIQYMNSDLSRKLGSEQLLYNFIHENKIEFEWLEWLGIIRNDWERNKTTLDINNFHFC